MGADIKRVSRQNVIRSCQSGSRRVELMNSGLISNKAAKLRHIPVRFCTWARTARVVRLAHPLLHTPSLIRRRCPTRAKLCTGCCLSVNSCPQQQGRQRPCDGSHSQGTEQGRHLHTRAARSGARRPGSCRTFLHFLGASPETPYRSPAGHLTLPYMWEQARVVPAYEKL